jgi:hypothetical protein
VVYLSVISVNTTFSNELDVGGGGGSDFPPVGISPAKIEVDSAHRSVSANTNRFIDVAPSEVEKDANGFA